MFDFKDSAMRELKPVAEDVEAAAERLSNTTVRIVSDGVSGVVSFGNDTWRAITAESPDSGAAPSPAKTPIQVHALSPLPCIHWYARLVPVVQPISFLCYLRFHMGSN